jgi:hypothetical protein
MRGGGGGRIKRRRWEPIRYGGLVKKLHKHLWTKRKPSLWIHYPGRPNSADHKHGNREHYLKPLRKLFLHQAADVRVNQLSSNKVQASQRHSSCDLCCGDSETVVEDTFCT